MGVIVILEGHLRRTGEQMPGSCGVRTYGLYPLILLKHKLGIVDLRIYLIKWIPPPRVGGSFPGIVDLREIWGWNSGFKDFGRFYLFYHAKDLGIYERI